MTTLYFDSSAFVKLVVDQDGSDLAATLWDGCDAAVSTGLAHPEVRAALAAAGRARRLDPPERRRAESMWEDFWAATRRVELTDDIAAHAGDLASRHALRGADAVHLASLLMIGVTETLFAVWDQRLRPGRRRQAFGWPLWRSPLVGRRPSATDTCCSRRSRLVRGSPPVDASSTRRWSELRRGVDAGMTTAEYAVGTFAACLEQTSQSSTAAGVGGRLLACCWRHLTIDVIN